MDLRVVQCNFCRNEAVDNEHYPPISAGSKLMMRDRNRGEYDNYGARLYAEALHDSDRKRKLVIFSKVSERWASANCCSHSTQYSDCKPTFLPIYTEDLMTQWCVVWNELLTNYINISVQMTGKMLMLLVPAGGRTLGTQWSLQSHSYVPDYVERSTASHLIR